MSDKKDWIVKLVPALAFIAGVIIASVGGIMTISSSLKMAIFDSGPYLYISEDQCKYDYSRDLAKGTTVGTTEEEGLTDMTDQYYRLDPEEVEVCINEKKQEEINRFNSSQKENIVDGISALIVGGVLLLSFRRRK
jgi:phenylpyruvate tautomerase PptA (4-oxalocrotonate tautomerase family)